jgi:hypothetical protein
LKRLEACMRRWEALQKKEKMPLVGQDELAEGAESEADEKTPTNGSPEPPELEVEDEEDDEEYEKRTNEIEKALQERLEQLTLKLSNQEKAQT